MEKRIEKGGKREEWKRELRKGEKREEWLNRHMDIV